LQNKNKIKLSSDEKRYQILISIIVGIIVLACLFPLIYVVGMSFTSEGEMIAKNYFVIIPEHPVFNAYKFILGQKTFFNSILISTARALLGVIAALALTIPGGYILAKKELPGRKWIMIFFIITMILHGGLIPSYLLMSKIRLINNFWVYIVPAFGATFNMLIIKLFVEGIPNDIIESADIDGATELQKMIFIAVPLLVPTICALGLFAAVGQWNSWFDTMLYIRNSKLYPVQYVIRDLMVSVTATDSTTGNLTIMERMTPEGIKMAAVVIGILPILCVYPFLQKYFIYGMYTGSVKG
jgi:putative aldouronate transport system permease protein